MFISYSLSRGTNLAVKFLSFKTYLDLTLFDLSLKNKLKSSGITALLSSLVLLKSAGISVMDRADSNPYCINFWLFNKSSIVDIRSFNSFSKPYYKYFYPFIIISKLEILIFRSFCMNDSDELTVLWIDVFILSERISSRVSNTSSEKRKDFRVFWIVGSFWLIVFSYLKSLFSFSRSNVNKSLLGTFWNYRDGSSWYV